MGMPGVSVKDAFLAVAKTDRYRNKWMPDLLWVDLIQKTFCSADPHFTVLTKAKLNRALGIDTGLAGCMDKMSVGNPWGIFRGKKIERDSDKTRRVTC